MNYILIIDYNNICFFETSPLSFKIGVKFAWNLKNSDVSPVVSKQGEFEEPRRRTQVSWPIVDQEIVENLTG